MQADQTGPQTIYKSREIPEPGPALGLVPTEPRGSLQPKRPIVLDPSLVKPKNIRVDLSLMTEKYRPWEEKQCAQVPGGLGQHWGLELGPQPMGWEWPGPGWLLLPLISLSLSLSLSHCFVL